MAIAFVQKVQAQTTVTAAALSTGAITTTTGNFISVQGSQAISATAPTSFTDNKANTYTIDKNLGDTTNGNFSTNVAVGSNLALTTGGAGHTFTINKTGGGVGLAIGACEYSHTGTMALSLTGSANGGTGGGTAMSPGAITPTGGTGTNYLYVSAATSDNISGATFTANTGQGWAMETAVSGTSSAKPVLASSDLISTGSKTGTITGSATAHWVAVVATYSETTGGGVTNHLLGLLGVGI